MIQNKKLDCGCPCDVCSTQDETGDPKPMSGLDFQNVVIDWFLKLEEEIEDLKILIKQHV